MFRLFLFVSLSLIVFPLVGQKQLYKTRKTFESESLVFNPDSSLLTEETFYNITGNITKEIFYYSYPEVWEDPSYRGIIYAEINYRYDANGNLLGSERITSGKLYHQYEVNFQRIDSWQEFIPDFSKDIETHFPNTKGKIDSVHSIHYESSLAKNKNWKQGSTLPKYERYWKTDTIRHIYKYNDPTLLISEEYHSENISLNEKHDTTRYTYDSLGRKIEETDLNGTILKYFYDNRNRLAKEEEYRVGIMEPALPMITEYDEEERKKIMEERGITEDEAYGLASRLQLVRTREYKYDAKNRLIKKLTYDETIGSLADPDIEEFWYNKNGLLIRKTTGGSGPKYYHFVYE